MVWFKSFTTSVVLALAATSASAATYTFDLQKIGSYHGDGDAGVLDGNVLTVTQTGASGSLTGTFTGKYIVDPTKGGGISGGALSGVVFDANNVQRHNNGLGVCNVGECSPSGDTHHTVDGVSFIEDEDPLTVDGAVFDFVEMAFFSGTDAVDITLTGLKFGWVGGVYNQYPGTNGLFEILVSELSETKIDVGALVAAAGVATTNPGSLGGRYSFAVPDIAAFTDNLFGVKAGINGSWKLMAVTVDYSVPEIPLPAAGWLLIGGLGGLAALRKSRKRG
jgi:hypothetical protein